MARSPSSAPFVARGREVRTMMAAVDRAAAGDPGLVLVGGDAGVGKSRLIDRVAELAGAAGATVVTTHCVDLGEVGLPYLPFAEALTRLHRPGGPVARVLHERPALGRLLPAGPPAPSGPPASPGPSGPPGPAAAGRADDDHTNRLQLFEGLAAALAVCGRPGAPLVLVVEDLHWADSSSRDVLRFLVARMRSEHLLLVASLRTDDLHRRHPLRPVLAELARHPRVQRVDVAPFDRDELREFRTALTGAPPAEDELRRLVERSEGNAYFAQELIEAGADGGALPGSLGDVLRARLEVLEPAVQDLARAASVAGRRVSEPLLRAVIAAGAATAAGAAAPAGTVTQAGAPAGSPHFDSALREAVARNVLGGEDGQIAFRHALLAEAVYGDLLPGEQVGLHGAYRDVLAAHPGLGSPAQLAHHALRAHDVATALRASREAARQAQRVLAPAEELRHLETVLRLWDAVPQAADLAGEDRIAVTVAAAVAAGRAGETERATALCREAVHAADGDPVRQAPVRGQLARFLLAVDHDAEAYAEAARALADVPAAPADASRAWTLAVHAFSALAVDRDDEAEASALAAVQEARRVDAPGAEADALATLAILVVDDRQQAAELLARAQERARTAGDVETELRCHFNLAANQYYAGLLDEAATLVHDGLARARSSGLLWNVHGVQLLLFDELVRYARGDLTSAPASGDAPPPAAAASLAAVQLYAAVA